MGIASHTPASFKNPGKIKRRTIINPNVRKKDIAADAFPSDNAVNKAEAKILHPENRKLNEKIEKPLFAISKTFLLFPANIPEIVSPARKENRNTKTETVIIKQKQVRTTFFSCFTCPPP